MYNVYVHSKPSQNRLLNLPSSSFSRRVLSSPLFRLSLIILWSAAVGRLYVRVFMLLTFVSEHDPVIWPLTPHAGPPSAIRTPRPLPPACLPAAALNRSRPSHQPANTNACLSAGVRFRGCCGGVSVLSSQSDMEANVALSVLARGLHTQSGT